MRGFGVIFVCATVTQFCLTDVSGQESNGSMFNRLRRGAQNFVFGQRPPHFLPGPISVPYRSSYSSKAKLNSTFVLSKGPGNSEHQPKAHKLQRQTTSKLSSSTPPTSHGWGWKPPQPHHGWGWKPPQPHHGWGWKPPQPHHGWGWKPPQPHHGWGWKPPQPHHGWGWKPPQPHHGWGWKPPQPHHGWGWPAPPHHGWAGSSKPLSSYYDSPPGHESNGPDDSSDPNDVPSDSDKPNDPSHPGSSPTLNENFVPTEGSGWGVCPTVPPRVINSLADIPPGWTVVRTGTNVVVPLGTLNFEPPSIPLEPFRLELLRQSLPSDYSMSWMEVSVIDMNPAENKIQNMVRIGGRPFNIHTETQGSSRPGSLLNRDRKLMPNTIEIVNAVIASKNVSAPLDGYAGGNNTRFTSALDARNARIAGGLINPFESQLKDLAQIFEELDTLERDTIRRFNRTTQEMNIGSIYATSTQRFTSPEPDSSEGLILDAYYNFGFPARAIEFGGLDLIKDLWEINLNESSPLDPELLGKSDEEIFSIFRRSVRSIVKNLRDVGKQGFIQAEDMASESFEQYQFFIEPPVGTCEEEVDPGENEFAMSGNSISGSGPVPFNLDDLDL